MMNTFRLRIQIARLVMVVGAWLAELIAPEIRSPVPSIADKYPYGTHDTKAPTNQ